jgi:type IV secretory pathway VirB10-like protein
MSKPSSNRRIVRTLLCAALSAVVVISTASMSARAADDEDEEEVAADVKFFRNLLAGLGWRRDGVGIDYRERSPLVVPPTLQTLPQPTPDTLAAKNNPAWPKDPDVQRAKQLKAERKKPRKTVEEESVAELPSQLNRPGAAIRAATQRPTGDSPDPTRPSTAQELGSKSVFNLDTVLGRNKDEYTTFVSEPPRASLIEPPPGYRTPSPAQPYGVGKQKWAPTAINPIDSPTMRGMER